MAAWASCGYGSTKPDEDTCRHIPEGVQILIRLVPAKGGSVDRAHAELGHHASKEEIWDDYIDFMVTAEEKREALA
jgi:hypothetical protein